MDKLAKVRTEVERIQLYSQSEVLKKILDYIDKVQEEPTIVYVITRCEEHSDYVEEVFFDRDKAQKYCDQFKENENEYARHITKVEVIL